ncbi:MAG TPA: AzlD domain-containing protein [Terriglobales bacterium]|nr:AzlD domain-containing protein [Terriglobales bacterium]
MELSRVQIILILGLVALGFRAVPLLFNAGKKFPETLDRLLRYLSYALLCSIISTTLFMKGARFEADAAPYRALALIVAVVITRLTKSAVTGMLVGMALVLALGWMR